MLKPQDVMVTLKIAAGKITELTTLTALRRDYGEWFARFEQEKRIAEGLN